MVRLPDRAADSPEGDRDELLALLCCQPKRHFISVVSELERAVSRLCFAVRAGHFRESLCNGSSSPSPLPPCQQSPLRKQLTPKALVHPQPPNPALPNQGQRNRCLKATRRCKIRHLPDKRECLVGLRHQDAQKGNAIRRAARRTHP